MNIDKVWDDLCIEEKFDMIQGIIVMILSGMVYSSIEDRERLMVLFEEFSNNRIEQKLHFEITDKELKIKVLSDEIDKMVDLLEDIFKDQGGFFCLFDQVQKIHMSFDSTIIDKTKILLEILDKTETKLKKEEDRLRKANLN